MDLDEFGDLVRDVRLNSHAEKLKSLEKRQEAAERRRQRDAFNQRHGIRPPDRPVTADGLKRAQASIQRRASKTNLLIPILILLAILICVAFPIWLFSQPSNRAKPNMERPAPSAANSTDEFYRQHMQRIKEQQWAARRDEDQNGIAPIPGRGE